jgi:threonine/homoserine/homoserine lactone efflux protein
MDLTWGLYFPLILAGAAYAVAAVVANVTASRGGESRAERVRDGAFLLVVAAGVWVFVLLLLSIFSEPDDLWDMLTITLVIAGFFAILLIVLFGISLLIGQVGRTTARRKRVTTDEV